MNVFCVRVFLLVSLYPLSLSVYVVCVVALSFPPYAIDVISFQKPGPFFSRA